MTVGDTGVSWLLPLGHGATRGPCLHALRRGFRRFARCEAPCLRLWPLENDDVPRPAFSAPVILVGECHRAEVVRLRGERLLDAEGRAAGQLRLCEDDPPRA